MVSDDQFNRLLIKSVEKRPVLFSVRLADYNNKNKKGEAFKGVQQELRDLGCCEMQVQSVYKRWISLKRKFRVEYFKVRSNGSSSKFHYYEELKFLIPYCEYHGSYKLAKRKCLEDDEDLELSETGDSGKHLSSGSSESKWSDNDNGEQLLNFLNSALDIPVPTQCAKIPAYTEFPSIPSKMNKNRIDSLANFLSGRELSQERNCDQKLEKPYDDHLNVDASSDSFEHPRSHLNSNINRSSENALFGSLVANELDKLPSELHNLVRAQVLILLAKANNNPNSVTSDHF